MFKVVTTDEMRHIEAAVDASLFSYDQMMLNAGRAASKYLRDRLELEEETRVTILVGKGNNGGDGLVLAHELAKHSCAQIRLYLLEARDQGDSNFAAVQAESLFITYADHDHDLRLLKSLIESSDVIVDALFGIGLRLPVRGKPARVLRAINLALNQPKRDADRNQIVNVTESASPRAAEQPFVLAIDCPSGIDCNDGRVDQNALAADATISFIAAKPGLLTFPAAAYVGELALSPLDIPEDFAPLADIQRTITDANTANALLPPRPIDGHKGTFGKVMVVGGSEKYTGAVALAAEAAYRAGAGLITVAASSQVVETVAGNLREPTYVRLATDDGGIAASNCAVVKDASDDYDALLIGCGLGRHPATSSFVRDLLGNDSLPPLIVDADALYILGQADNWWDHLSDDTIITPHPGEMARLCRVSIPDVNANRWEIVTRYARAWNLVIILKGAHSLIAEPDGRVTVIPFKTDALSTAGTGDVLAGMVAGLRAQGISAFDSARLGAYVHALAGKIAAEDVGSSRSVIAGDVLASLGRAFREIEGD